MGYDLSGSKITTGSFEPGRKKMTNNDGRTLVYDATFHDLLSCPECGSKQYEFKSIKEEPEYVSKPFVGVLHCKGKCSKTFLIKMDAPFIEFLKNVLEKKLKQAGLPCHEIASLICYIR